MRCSLCTYSVARTLVLPSRTPREGGIYMDERTEARSGPTPRPVGQSQAGARPRRVALRHSHDRAVRRRDSCRRGWEGRSSRCQERVRGRVNSGRKKNSDSPMRTTRGTAGAPGREQRCGVRRRCGGARSAWGATSSEGGQR